MARHYRSSDRIGARLASLFILPLALVFAQSARADALDTVLDALYKAGVIDGNVKAAKPLIACLADGGNAASCAAGNAGGTELANDPQVKNVLDIYLAFHDQDYYTVLKKAGITVGCALIPGGEVKDVACGELGKIAAQVLDGVGSVLGAVGSFVGSLFGGGSDPPPMSEENYYRLNFMPWYHWSVVHQLDNDTPANVQVLNAPMAACVDYFDNHQYSSNQAKTACNNLRTRLGNSGYAIGNAFRDEQESYFQLHFAPKLYEWAELSFNNKDNINIYAKQAMNTCLWDERQHLPLPNPGFDQCVAMKSSLAGLPDMFKTAGDQLFAQCQAQANARSVPADNDAYTRICKPMTNRIIGQVIFVAMADLKSRMDTAAAAGCPNNGYPKSIHCDSFEAHDACMNAMPEHASMCALDFDKAITGTAAAAGCTSSGKMDSIACPTYQARANCTNAMPTYAQWCQLDSGKALSANIEQIWAAINTDDAPCTAFGDAHSNLACPHPMQIVHCNAAKKSIEEVWGAESVAGITCDAFDDPDYNQRKEQAARALAAANADYQAPRLQLQSQALIRATPSQPCQLARHDPLVITCVEGFRLEAIPERAAAVYQAINGDNQGGRPRSIYCLPDVDNDGAEAPCLEGAPAPELAPPAMRPQIKPVIRTDGNRG